MGRKRLNGEGSIYRRRADGLWIVSVPVGFDDGPTGQLDRGLSVEPVYPGPVGPPLLRGPEEVLGLRSDQGDPLDVEGDRDHFPRTTGGPGTHDRQGRANEQHKQHDRPNARI
jgi:hypothetical protein